MEEQKEHTLVDWLLAHYPEIKTVGDDPALRPGIVHRLDKDTSGVMVVARTQEYFEYLKSLFQNHEVRKTYRAVVVGIPKDASGVIDKPIGIRNGTLKRSVRSKKMAKDAVTEYRVIKSFQFPTSNFQTHSTKDLPFALSHLPLALLEVYPRTGRTHQIRVHLASIGHPIVGDKLYGRRVAKGKGQGANRKLKVPIPYTLDPIFESRLMLHAAAIEFPEKNGKVVRFEAETPKKFQLANSPGQIAKGRWQGASNPPGTASLGSLPLAICSLR